MIKKIPRGIVISACVLLGSAAIASYFFDAHVSSLMVGALVALAFYGVYSASCKR